LIALPVGEVHVVAALERAQRVVQPAKVFGAVDEHFDTIALRPRGAVAASPVNRRRRVPALTRGQEPIVEPQ
jgi:hypothetical protein